MSEYSERLRMAVDHLIKIGEARTMGEVGRKVGLKPSTLSMILSGKREPGIDLFHIFVKEYPVNLHWLVTGEGDIYKDTISRLRRQVRELKAELAFTRREKSCLQMFEK